MHDGNEAVHMALKLREQFDSPAEMLASMEVDMALSGDVADEVGGLALDHDAQGIAWLASVFYAAGRIDADAHACAVYSLRADRSSVGRKRSAICRPNSDASA